MIRYLHRNDAADAPETDAANHERETEMLCEINWVECSDRDAARAMGERVLWVSDGVTSYAAVLGRDESVDAALAAFAANYDGGMDAIESHEVIDA